jgi:hypothetical protein
MESGLGFIGLGGADRIVGCVFELDAEKHRVLDPAYAAFN